MPETALLDPALYGTAILHHLVPDLPRTDPSFERRNPADDTEVVFAAPSAGAAEVDAAVVAATAAQPGWAATNPVTRGRYLLDAAELLRRDAERVARDLTREEGKLIAEARGEVARTIELLRFFGGLGWYRCGEVFPGPSGPVRTDREPIGVVGLITPWNFPLAIPTWKLAPALVSGCTVVMKPAEITALSVHHLARVLAEAGLPTGVFSVVFGSGRVAGQALVDHPGVAAVSFTGSDGVGEAVGRACHTRGARVQLEMGGKNALVVSPTAPSEIAGSIAVRGAFGLTGQACTATSRMILLPGADAALAALLGHAGAIIPGNGLDAGSGMGPVVSDRQADRIREQIAAGRSAGATLLQEPAEGATPRLLGPHVFEGVAASDPLAQEEIFGPVVAVLRAGDLDEAIALVNGTRYGLASGIVTADLREAQAFARGARTGIVKINEPTTGSAVNVPFGGVGASSSNTFREQGYAALDFFTWTKTVYETGIGA